MGYGEQVGRQSVWPGETIMREEKEEHPLNWKEKQEFLDPNTKHSWFVNFIRDFENNKYPILEKITLVIWKLFILFKPIRKAVDNSAGGSFGTMFRHARAKNYQAAYEVALRKLKEEKLRKNEVMLGHHLWWSFMSYACQCLDNFESVEKREELIQLMLEGPVPFQGFDVSNSLCHAARWRLETQQEVQGIDFARRARDADPTFYYAWYLLGWFSLAMNRVDVEPLFLKAIELDSTIWPIIRQDPLCSQKTEMLRSLKEHALAKGIALKD